MGFDLFLNQGSILFSINAWIISFLIIEWMNYSFNEWINYSFNEFNMNELFF